MCDQITERCLTHEAGLDAGGLGDEGVVGVAPHVELLVQVQPLELTLQREGNVMTQTLHPSIQHRRVYIRITSG